jgi:hypothetical protein
MVQAFYCTPTQASRTFQLTADGSHSTAMAQTTQKTINHVLLNGYSLLRKCFHCAAANNSCLFLFHYAGSVIMSHYLTCSILNFANFHLEDQDSMFLLNTGNHVPDYVSTKKELQTKGNL